MELFYFADAHAAASDALDALVVTVILCPIMALFVIGLIEGLAVVDAGR